jgi:hypothetical protein
MTFNTRPLPLLVPRFSTRFSEDAFWEAVTLLRFEESLVLDEEGVRCRLPGPTEAGRFRSCSGSTTATGVEGSIGERMVGRPCIGCA